jgi:pimeloyl-ACP methyl ester carboxylesterase
MPMKLPVINALAAAALLSGCSTTAVPSLALRDPPADPAHPADMAAFVIPAQDGAMNAMMYLAPGAQPHPTLLLLHGFPGNEQNLDLAQAARRAGWNVLTLHYRGSWGSPGKFSFGSAADDAHTALAWLRDAANDARYAIDPSRIAVAGHSMGGFTAASAAAADPAVAGLFLLDAWNPAATAKDLASPEGRAIWHGEFVADLPPLAGTSEDALMQEIVSGADRLDTARMVARYGDRPLAIYGAERGDGDTSRGYMATARAAGNTHVEGAVWPTDHPFSDKRIALSQALVAWLGTLGAQH